MRPLPPIQTCNLTSKISPINLLNMNQSPPSASNRERRASVYAFLALLLALFSYYWANRYPEYTWDGPIILFLAMGLFFLAFSRVEKTAPSPAPTSDLPPSPIVGGGVGGGGRFSLFSLDVQVK